MSCKEGRRIRGGIPMDAVSPFIMPTRAGASNKFSATVDVGKCDELLRKKKSRRFGRYRNDTCFYGSVCENCFTVARY